MARKARPSDLGHSIAPAVNGDGYHAAPDIGPQMVSPRVASPFPPIADYAFLSDCEVNCLIAPTGRVEWMCLPRPDGPSVFAAMLDRAAGSFRFGPTGVQVPAGRRYLPGTLVLETTWRTRTGWLIVRDAMCIGPWYHSQRRSGTYRRPPSDYEAEHILLRTARCVVGSVELSLDCQPVFDYGQTAARWEYAGTGYNEAIASGGADEVPIRLVTDLRVGFEGPGAHATKVLRQGERAYVAMVWPRSRHSTGKEYWAEHPAPATVDEAFTRVERTAEYWREWINRGEFPEHPWQAYLQRSALTLKGLTYSPTGALLAAATSSLPESIGGERNWDYRYTWIRDAAFSLYGLLRLGFTEEAASFMQWLTDRTREWHIGPGGPLQIMYGIDGRKELTEFEHPTWSGYRDSHPVRIGNAAADQRQLDIYGELIDSIYLYNKYGMPISYDTWENVRRIVDWLCENWDQADEGIWETRGGQKDFTYSRLMSWVAVERAIRMNRARGLPGDIVGWLGERDRIYNQIMKKGWSEDRQAFVQHYGSDVLDASILLMPLVLFIAPTDPRWLSTLDAIGDELVSDSLVYRYNPEASPDGLLGREGTFSICSFWYVEALTRAGRLEEARLAFEKMLTYANHLGLYSEEIGPSGEQLGNFPQAFTHLALISAGFNLDRALG